ncbi:hypothetical protein K456DRAFT_1721795 [Colletotrichum gloeosporioides 23]|nr:hypothetical protein K456DRAFT_1721795 [Colletotrichum gloeosporioides 23]
MSPNSKFADIEAIRRAQIEAGELENSTDEFSESENPTLTGALRAYWVCFLDLNRL